jgi:hypothetical protein
MRISSLGKTTLRRLVFVPGLEWRHIFARRGVSMVHGKIVHLPDRKAEQVCGVARQAAIVARARDKLNDLCAHENISQSTMRISPLTASAIRQAAAAMRVLLLRAGMMAL